MSKKMSLGIARLLREAIGAQIETLIDLKLFAFLKILEREGSLAVVNPKDGTVFARAGRFAKKSFDDAKRNKKASPLFSNPKRRKRRGRS